MRRTCENCEKGKEEKWGRNREQEGGGGVELLGIFSMLFCCFVWKYGGVGHGDWTKQFLVVLLFYFLSKQFVCSACPRFFYL